MHLAAASMAAVPALVTLVTPAGCGGLWPTPDVPEVLGPLLQLFVVEVRGKLLAALLCPISVLPDV